MSTQATQESVLEENGFFGIINNQFLIINIESNCINSNSFIANTICIQNQRHYLVKVIKVTNQNDYDTQRVCRKLVQANPNENIICFLDDADYMQIQFPLIVDSIETTFPYNYVVMDDYGNGNLQELLYTCYVIDQQMLTLPTVYFLHSQIVNTFIYFLAVLELEHIDIELNNFIITLPVNGNNMIIGLLDFNIFNVIYSNSKCLPVQKYIPDIQKEYSFQVGKFLFNLKYGHPPFQKETQEDMNYSFIVKEDKKGFFKSHGIYQSGNQQEETLKEIMWACLQCNPYNRPELKELIDGKNILTNNIIQEIMKYKRRNE